MLLKLVQVESSLRHSGTDRAEVSDVFSADSFFKNSIGQILFLNVNRTKVPQRNAGFSAILEAFMRITTDQQIGTAVGSMLICLFSSPFLAVVSGLFTLGFALLYNGLCQWKPQATFILKNEGLPLIKQSS